MSDCPKTDSGDADMKFKGIYKSLEAVQKCLRNEKVSMFVYIKGNIFTIK